MTVHKIYTDYQEDSSYWQCSCGRAGTAPTYKVDVASDKHIGPLDSRIDTNRPPL